MGKDGVLTISGWEESRDQTDDRDVRLARGGRAFVRTIELPAGADTSAITARTTDDFIEITVPVAAGPSEPITITPSAS